MTDKGFTDKVKGEVEDAVGDVTNNKNLKAKGLLNKAEGKVKEVASNIKETAGEVKEKVEGKLKKK